jgi:hypothetical protein
MELKEALELIGKNLEAPEVKEFTTKFNPLAAVTKDNVGEFVEKSDTLKSYRDSFHTKGLETWKANNLKKLVDEEIAKANPQETPEQKKIRELEARLNEEASARKKESLKNLAIKKLTEKKLPVDIVDNLIGSDEESTEKTLTAYEQALESYKKALTEQLLKNNGRDPINPEPAPGMITREQAREMAKKDPAKFNKLFEEGKIKL